MQWFLRVTKQPIDPGLLLMNMLLSVQIYVLIVSGKYHGRPSYNGWRLHSENDITGWILGNLCSYLLYQWFTTVFTIHHSPMGYFGVWENAIQMNWWQVVENCMKSLSLQHPWTPPMWYWGIPTLGQTSLFLTLYFLSSCKICLRNSNSKESSITENKGAAVAFTSLCHDFFITRYKRGHDWGLIVMGLRRLRQKQQCRTWSHGVLGDRHYLSWTLNAYKWAWVSCKIIRRGIYNAMQSVDTPNVWISESVSDDIPSAAVPDTRDTSMWRGWCMTAWLGVAMPSSWLQEMRV